MGIILFCVFVCLLLFLFLLVYRKFYFKPLSVLCVSNDTKEVIAVKPSSKWFKSVSCGRSSGFVHLGNGYYAFYVSDPDSFDIFFNSISVKSCIYVFRVSRLGRFISVDLSDRSLFDILKKIVKE